MWRLVHRTLALFGAAAVVGLAAGVIAAAAVTPRVLDELERKGLFKRPEA